MDQCFLLFAEIKELNRHLRRDHIAGAQFVKQATSNKQSTQRPKREKKLTSECPAAQKKTLAGVAKDINSKEPQRTTRRANTPKKRQLGRTERKQSSKRPIQFSVARCNCGYAEEPE